MVQTGSAHRVGRRVLIGSVLGLRSSSAPPVLVSRLTACRQVVCTCRKRDSYNYIVGRARRPPQQRRLGTERASQWGTDELLLKNITTTLIRILKVSVRPRRVHQEPRGWGAGGGVSGAARAATYRAPRPPRGRARERGRENARNKPENKPNLDHSC